MFVCMYVSCKYVCMDVFILNVCIFLCIYICMYEYKYVCMEMYLYVNGQIIGM